MSMLDISKRLYGGTNSYRVTDGDTTETTARYGTVNADGTVTLDGSDEAVEVSGADSFADGDRVAVVTGGGVTQIATKPNFISQGNGGGNSTVTLDVAGETSARISMQAGFADGTHIASFGLGASSVGGVLGNYALLIADRLTMSLGSSHGDLYDWVTSEGATGSWTYRKWASGAVDAWYAEARSLALTTAIGGVYCCADDWSVDMSALGLPSNPVIQATVRGASGAEWATVRTQSATAATIRILSADSRTQSVALMLHVHAE